MYMSFAFIYVCHLFWNLESLVTQSCLTLCKPMDCNPSGSWDFTGKNPGVGSHSLLQGVFLILGSNPDLLYCRQIPYCLSYHQGSPWNLEGSINWNFKDWTHIHYFGFYVARICEWFSAKWGFAHSGEGFPPSACPISLIWLMTLITEKRGLVRGEGC